MNIQETINKRLEFVNIDAWKNVVGEEIIIVEMEHDNEHQAEVQRVFKKILPKATIYNRDDLLNYIGVSDLDYTEKWIKYIDYLISIGKKPYAFGASYKLEMADRYVQLANYLYNKGIPFFLSSGNDGDKITPDELAFYDKIIACGSVNPIYDSNWNITGYKRANYTEWGEALDFCGFTFWSSGTSFGRPFVMAIACSLMQITGRLDLEGIYELLQKYSNKEYDPEVGWGIPILPNPSEVSVMIFEDTKNHWAKDNIDLVSDLEIMSGYPEGDFKPEKEMTRAEVATVIANMIRKGFISK